MRAWLVPVFAMLVQGTEPSAGFSTTVASHVERSVGVGNLPGGQGSEVVPGVFITLGLDHLDVFDHEALPLSQGRVADATPSPACRSGCARVLFETMEWEWLRLAVEGATLGVDIPVAVHFAAHRDVPAATLLQAAYAAAESRPVTPPNLSIVTSSAGRGLRSQAFFLLPPEGLLLQQGSAALALTIQVTDGKLRLSGSDSNLGPHAQASNLGQLRALLVALKKRHAGKDTVVIDPGDAMTTGELIELIAQVKPHFSRIVLSRGQTIRL